MARVPNHNYYSDEWDSEELVIPDEHLALNKDKIGLATPYAISPQIAVFTRKYSERVYAENQDNELGKLYATLQEDWDGIYREGNSVFVPQNRWTHEVVRPPIKIEENLYKINVSADVYPHKNQFVHTYESGSEAELMEFVFITRTLYKYIDSSKMVVDEEELDDEWCPRIYNWKIRWLPKDDAILTFFTNEDMVYWKTKEYKFDTKELPKDAEGVIDVPVIFKKGLKKDLHYIKHDTTVLYMKVDYHEK